MTGIFDSQALSIRKPFFWVVSCIFFCLLIAGPVRSQVDLKYPAEPAEFIGKFSSEVERITTKREVADFMKTFQTEWEIGTFNPQEKSAFIAIANRLLQTNAKAFPDIHQFARGFEALKNPESITEIPSSAYFEVSDSCFRNMDRNGFMHFQRFMDVFARHGEAFKTSNASWTFSEISPKLQWTIPKGKGATSKMGFPELVFAGTDLTYRSTQDTTVISLTRGKLNVRNRIFLGDGGQLDWSKVGLDKNMVYCRFKDYKANLNYPTLDIDSVTFTYSGLISKPLIGKYEDRNRGFRDVNKANYPYFRSYEGGVVIENLIPNVRYEGGFSLRGVKKIGSAYYKWVDLPPEPEKEKEEGVVEEEDDYWSSQETVEDPFAEEDSAAVEEAVNWEEEEGYEPGSQEAIDAEMDAMEESHPGQELRLIPARMLIMRGDAPIMKLEADEFVLDMQKLHSEHTAMTLYISGDSIYHPSLELLYEVESDEITLMKRLKEKEAHMPFVSGYHNFGMYFNAIKWHRMSDSINFTFIIDKKNEVGAIESVDFYQRSRLNQFKGVMRFNPVTGIHMFSGEKPGEVITPEAVVNHMMKDATESDRKLETDKLYLALSDLQGSGFIKWDDVSREITITEKLSKWGRMARGKLDYDVIQVLSRVETGNHATLDVKSKDFLMRGVDFFSLSDSQFIRVKPTDKEVLVGKNRNMVFGGIVAAGKLDFYGHTKGMFNFEYDNFKIFCDSLDSMRFILVRNTEPGFVFTPLQKALRNTSIEGVTGAIYINKPDNKSGKEYLPEYSIFDSYTNSYVYWARDSIHDGVYTKDKLYFSIDPFVLDSLETFDETKLSFEGEFESSEIFPRFRQRLVVMDDFTLGLKHMTGDTPMTAYEGKGSYSGAILLDGSGLHGDGKMDFMGTSASSDTFEFYFDSVKAVTKDFFSPGGVKEGISFPEIRSKEVDYKWLTKQDAIEIETRGTTPIVLFEGQGTFDGKMMITKEGVKGHGTLTMGEVSITGRDIAFGEFDVSSKNGSFDIADKVDKTKPQFKSLHMDVRFDVKTRQGDFATNKVGELNAEFTAINYKTSLGNGTYDGNAGLIHIEKSGQYAKDNYFVSTDPLQDSLRFQASSADYNTATQELNVSGVPSIFVADAKITPKGEAVQIKADGKMKDLTESVIECNQYTNYHRIYDARVTIESAKNYRGDGKYDYIEIDGNDQYINMKEIMVDDTNTVAIGEIAEVQKFHLTEKIYFKGTTSLLAPNKYMIFKGQVKIESANPFFRDTWFDYEGEVNPDSVFIPVNDPKVQGKALAVGLHFISANRVFYSTFLQPKKEDKNEDILLAKGGLSVLRATEEFVIGTEEKLKGNIYRGTVVKYHDANNTITSQGLLKFPYKITKDVWQVKMAGAYKDDMKLKETSTDMVVGVNLSCLPASAMTKLADAFNRVVVTNDDIDFHDQLFVESMAEFLDPEGAKEETNTKSFVTQAQTAMLYTDIKIAKDLPFTLMMTDVNFSFHVEKYKSLYCNSEIGLLGLQQVPVNKRLMSKIEYNFGKVSPTGVRFDDSLMVYLEADENTWMWLRVYGEQVDIVTSDAAGCNAELIKELGKSKKEEGFRFNFVDEGVKDEYMSRFINRYVFVDDE